MTTALSDTLFRAYDIRGIFEDTLTVLGAELIGQAIGSEVIDRGGRSVVVARDGRLSSPSLLDALAKGLQASGCNVVDVGLVPTPVLYFATYHFQDADSGVMITGSHNPPDYNGFKIVIRGTTLSGDAIQALKNRIQQRNFSEGQGARDQREILPAYLAALKKHHQLARPMKVVVDCGNGAAGVLAPEAIAALGCEVIPLYTEVDGTFPNHHPDPGDVGTLNDLIDIVQRENADLGLAFDGDGDRLGVVLPNGNVVFPDIMLMALAEDLVSRVPGAKVIFDVKCTGELFDIIRDAGGEPEMWRTGHSLIKARMKETGALLAGEMSGHIFFAEDWYGFDDAVVAAARILGILSRHDGDAIGFFDRYPKLCTTPEITIPVTEETKFAIVEYLQNHADLGDGERTIIDGIRMDYEGGWGLCRASNTSPKLVTRYEAKTEDALLRIRTLFEEAIEQAITVVGDVPQGPNVEHTFKERL
ncbi:phosphomannomutase/phosphoglucomutase [Alloalcanivorax xenomutans]|uniref:phosphomannomutase/phosphoglucomutase n=1 Tax=Alloalcanivorax xenomutans TaxID=1094342 RepID=UPI0007A73BBE|nr:phosphomannomutase/phosphoglucomutase [Alloalcanivorax xenomutans]KYZ85103.1 phosphoglucomutase [Alcanivorax sp. KX64203]MCE7523536.1 phosphomannomutase/phosphoglucomutase [Alloalcanivorax xenomutans]PHS70792.1 MAG: phosphomannomutase/phosphoglucomutase [Alcanivorax sp.]WOA33116.1 phosphomannomutase/phosphoglucomutase [Alloalcanivorax xenomutans]